MQSFPQELLCHFVGLVNSADVAALASSCSWLCCVVRGDVVSVLQENIIHPAQLDCEYSFIEPLLIICCVSCAGGIWSHAAVAVLHLQLHAVSARAWCAPAAFW